MANTLVIREKLDLVRRVSEGIPISKRMDSRVFQAQTRRVIVVGTTLVLSGHFGGSPEEQGELGLRVGTKVEEVKEKFKVMRFNRLVRRNIEESY